MAASLATVSDYLFTTSGLIAANSNKTVMVWAKESALPTGGHYNCAFESTNLTPPTATAYAGIFTEDATGAKDSIQANNGSFSDRFDITATAATVWVHHCLTYDATGHNFLYYRNGIVLNGVNVNVNALTWTYEVCGGDGFDHVGTYVVAQYRAWTRILSIFEIQTEMQSASAVSSTNLWRDTPLTSNLTDISGNGRNWTQAGSATFVAGPSYPANNSQATATVISAIPTSFSFSYGDGFFAWYVYTPVQSYEAVIGVFAVTGSLSDTIEIQTYGAGLSAWPDGGSIVADNRPIQVPLLAATPVYFRMETLSHTDNNVSVSMLPGPMNTVPFGSFAINDDTAGFALALLDQTTGLPLRHVNPFPNGENVGVFNDGHILLDDKANGRMQLFAPDLTAGVTVAYPGGAGSLNNINSDRTSRYYVMPFSSTTIYIYNGAGTQIGSEALGVVAALAVPNRGNTILYYSVAGTNRPIKRWDLVAHGALADLVAGVGANYFITNTMLTLADDTILVGYGKTSGGTDYFVKHYATNGTVLNTYTLADHTEKINWIQLGLTDDSSRFLIWSFPVTPTGTSKFTYLKVSDGSGISSTSAVSQYESGVDINNGATLTPQDRFGHSLSCPIWVQALTLASPASGGGGGGGGIGAPVVFPIRRVRITPTLSHENRRMYHRMLVLDVSAGVGQDGLGQGVDPVVMMRYSDDSGYTWSDELTGTIGKIGRYGWQVFWFRLGRARNRVYEFVCSDPVSFTLQNAYVDVEEGTGVR